MKLPAPDQAFVDIRKLREYCLNPTHARGKHKARVFTSALGLTAKDAEWLRDELIHQAHSGDAILVQKDEFGQRYVLDFHCRRAGRSAWIRTRWIVRDEESFPRLTTCFVRGET